VDDDALSRIDRRTASTDESVRRLTEILQEMRADGLRRDQWIEDQRLAANQWNLRSERVMRDLLTGFQELRAEIRESTAEIRESTANIREWRYEGVAEARAQRAALFAILDELKRRGGPATA
jgi:hypothetical protein